MTSWSFPAPGRPACLSVTVPAPRHRRMRRAATLSSVHRRPRLTQRPMWEALPAMLAATRDDAGPLLGRDAEMELLRSRLDGLERGGGALVLRGEPGIGKSRLLAEAAALAREHDIAVLRTEGV